MKKLVLLLSVFVLLIVATGAVSAGKPAPDTFTITGYQTNNPFTDPESVIAPPEGPWRLHITARGGGATDTAYDGLCALYAQELKLERVTTCQALCLATQKQACGVTGLINGKPVNGEFTFDEWIDIVNPITDLTAKNEGAVVITALNKKGTAVVNFDGTVDRVTYTVLGRFNIEKNEGRGAYASLKGQGDYTGGATPVFTVTFTVQPKH